jgi:hypothetical protein
MGLDFAWLDDRSGRSDLSLSYEDWSRIRNELLFLKQKTGVWLDPYSNTRLSPDHARLLRDALQARTEKSEGVQELILKLDDAVKQSRWMLIIGD